MDGANVEPGGNQEGRRPNLDALEELLDLLRRSGVASYHRDGESLSITLFPGIGAQGPALLPNLASDPNDPNDEQFLFPDGVRPKFPGVK